MSIWKRINCFFLILCPLAFFSKTVTPLDYGLAKAHNGQERFEVLMQCHKDAVSRNCSISYSGIKSIELNIPVNASSIPLPEKTDFAGVKLIVNNTSQDYALFRMKGDLKEISMTGELLDEGIFARRSDLNSGYILLIIEDQTPWVQERIGYEGGTFKRKDVVVLKNGIAQNKTVMPYNNSQTQTKAWMCNVSDRRKVVKNLIFERTRTSTFKTYPISIENQYNVELSNITTTTPQGTSLISDCGIGISNCANIFLNDIHINGTYSMSNKSGYGMRLLNVYNVRINRMYARANWGVFGNNCVSKVVLKDCDINRFDIHCYGRDVTSINCKYSELYNQFSSYYGTLRFKNCTFKNFIPILIESSYNAYTPFDVVWENCVFNLTKDKNYLMTLFGVKEPINSRPELREKCIPNLTLKNCKIKLEDDVKDWCLIQTGRMAYKGEMGYLSSINIINTKVEGDAKDSFDYFSQPILLKKHVQVKISRTNITKEQ